MTGALALSAIAQEMAALSTLTTRFGVESGDVVNALRQAEVFAKCLYTIAPAFPARVERLAAYLDGEGYSEMADSLRERSRSASPAPSRPDSAPVPVSDLQRQRNADALALATALVACLPRLSVTELIEQLIRRGHAELLEPVRQRAAQDEHNKIAGVMVRLDDLGIVITI